MTGLLAILQYATGNGFWVFVGCAMLLGIATSGVTSAVGTAFAFLTTSIKRH
jgi:hypothetical protein